MLSENLKILRKNKGMTQEELASKVNVVRQTVSKWEKDLSVPDADMLQQIAEILEVEVSQLLGAEIVSEESKNEIAEQLSRINEQLVIKNRRSRRIWRIVGFTFLTILVLYIVSTVLGVVFFSFSSGPSGGQTSVISEEKLEIEE